MLSTAGRNSLETRQVDRGIVGGIGISFGLILLAIATGGSVLNFLDFPSLLIVVGGTLGATVANFSMAEITQAWKVFRLVATTESSSPLNRIGHMVQLASKVRQHGLLVLEREARHVSDPFLKLALELTADGQSGDDIRRILEIEMITSNDRDSRVVQVFQTMGQFSPAMGLIGTLVGLIQMLSILDQPSTIGPAMSLALVTTLYGAILANLVFIPIAGKLKNRSAEEALVKAITIEGALGLGRQENAIVIEQRLQSFMPLVANI
jgi:chemotaxis protein MotA